MLDRKNIIALLIGIFGAAIGTLFVLAAWHLYVDHKDFHALIQFIQRQNTVPK